MTSTVILNQFKAPNFTRSRFTRPEYEIQDANLHFGDVRPFACPEVMCNAAGNLQSLYSLPSCECLGFNDTRDIVRGFCDQQHFQIQNGTLRQSTEQVLCAGGGSNLAGAPFGAAPNVTAQCGGCDGTGVSYVVTYITRHAGIEVESAPSPASTIVASGGEIPNANVSWSAAPPGYDTVAVRLYRVETAFEDGTDGIAPHSAEFVFVREFNSPFAGSFFDNVPTHATGGPLTTYEPMAFPAPDDLVGVARTTDGIAVADSHRVYISLPGQPQFTYDGVVEIEDEILAIRAMQNTIFVLTDNYPVKLSYRHTDQIMTIDKQTVDRKLPLKSKRSLSIYDGTLYFASTYSVYSWDLSGYGNDIKSVFNNIINPEQYKEMEPETIRGVAYEYGYMFTGDGMDYSLMVELGEDGTDTPLRTSVMPITYINPDCFGLDYDGHIIYQQRNNVYRWDYRRDGCGDFNIADNVIHPLCDQCDCCPWKMSMYYDNEGKNTFSRMRVEWDERSATHLEVTFKHFAFGEERNVIGPLQVISSRGFRMPRYRASQTFCVEVTGCGILSEIRLATSSQELVANSNNQVENRDI